MDTTTSFYLYPDAYYQIFVHDPNFFFLHAIYKTYPAIKAYLAEGYSTAYVSVVKHFNLNTKTNPCTDDPNYSFNLCVQRSINRKVGCQFNWYRKNKENVTTCSNLEQLKWLTTNYSRIVDNNLKETIDQTGCMKPCQYNEYVVDGIESFPGDRRIFMKFSNQDVVIKKELKSYSLLSLLSDLGGSLGLFLGFSFLMVWESAWTIAISIKNYLSTRIHCQTPCRLSFCNDFEK